MPDSIPVSSPLAFLDHSLLAPTVTSGELTQACHDAEAHGFASVCLLPYFVPQAAEILKGTGIVVSTVVSFPHGTLALGEKLAEASAQIRRGAKEIDVVVNISLLLSGLRERVRREILDITAMTHDEGGRVKWIFETAYLGEADKRFLCEACTEAKADWVKTSTGFGPSGANEEDIHFLRNHCPPSVQVKASGGIRSLAQVERFLELGASRIGTSRTLAIAAEWYEKSRH